MQIPSNNQTWSSGLIAQVPLGRGQRVEVSSNQAIELVVCKLHNPSGMLDSSNLNPQVLLKPGGNSYQMPIVGVKNYCGLTIKMAPQTDEFKLKLQTTQAVEGIVTARITYNVMESLTVLQRNDVLEDLKMEAQRTAQHSIGMLTHAQITQQQVENSLGQLNVAFLGLRIQRVIIPYPVQWPPELMKDLREVVGIQSAGRRQRATDDENISNQRYRNDLIMQELHRLSIVHPEVVMYVLANYEKHNSNVMQAVQAAHQEQRGITDEQRLIATRQLQDLIDKDLIDRTQLEPLIEKTLRDVTYGQHQAPGASLPIVPQAQGYLSPPQQQYNPQLDNNQAPQQLTQGDDATILGSNHPIAVEGALICQKGSEGTLTVSGTNIWFSLCAGETKLGRRERSNHIAITDGGVSREHSVIRRRAAQHFVIANTKSDIVTHIDGKPLGNDEQILQNGNQIQIGPVIFIFQLNTDSQTTGSDEDETRF